MDEFMVASIAVRVIEIRRWRRVNSGGCWRLSAKVARGTF